MHKISKNVVSVSTGTLQEYAKEDLGKKDYKVLLFLMDYLSSVDFTRIDIKQIADTLEISKDDVKKSLQTLQDKYIIIKGSSEHVTKGYKFYK